LDGTDWPVVSTSIASRAIPASSRASLFCEKHPGHEKKWKTFIWSTLIKYEKCKCLFSMNPISIKISEDLKQKAPKMALGVIQCCVSNSQFNAELWQEIQKVTVETLPKKS